MIEKWHEFIQSIREFYIERSYIEVSTSILLKYPNLDPNIEPIPVKVKMLSETRTFWLRTSPEYSMKKILAKHKKHIFQIGKVFRNNEFGRLHRPEFHMLEWYRVGEDYRYLIKEIKELLEMLGFERSEEIKLNELFYEIFKENIPEDTEELKELLRGKDIHFEENEDWETLFFRFLIEAEEILPENPVFLVDFPERLSALAKVRNGIAERFELYIKRIEVANGWTEETDMHEVRKRLEKEAKKRNLPLDEEFIEVHRHLPECAGCSVGLERLFMLKEGIDDINLLVELYL